MKSFLNHEGHQNPFSGSKVTAIFTEGGDFAYWWSFIGKGLRLQPAQQAQFYGRIRQCGRLVRAQCSMGLGRNPIINSLIQYTFKINFVFVEKFPVEDSLVYIKNENLLYLSKEI